MSTNKKISYKTSGVSIDKGEKLVNLIKPLAKKTARKEVREGIGGFAALSDIPSKYKNPMIVSATDGVGTKIEIAELMNDHKTIGQDLVAMCVNDLITGGAEPLFFLDYLVTERINLKKSKDILSGISDGCLISNCSLIGGETAEHPNAFPKNRYDLAGFCVGVIEKKDALKKTKLKKEDILIGIESSGLHSNGFSLIRKLIKTKRLKLKSKFGNTTLGKVLLKPTKIYVNEILRLNKLINIKAMAHITGGGLTGNLKRIIPNKLAIELIDKSLFVFQKNLFDLIQSSSNLSRDEMLETFNCGFGMVLAIDKKDFNKVDKFMKNNKIKYKLIGKFISSKNKNKEVIIN